MAETTAFELVSPERLLVSKDVEMVVVANGKEKCVKCITQWICCTPYKAEAVCNPDEYSLATLQTAKKDLVIAECEGRLSWSMSS